MAQKDNKSNYNFLEIRSLRKAFFIRLFEALLLTVIISITTYFFPNLNLLAVIIFETLLVILFSYFFFKKILDSNKSGEETESSAQIIPESLEGNEEKRKFFLEIIKIRLDGIGEASKRARITFIILLIASCSMLITLFNTYYSWTQNDSGGD